MNAPVTISATVGAWLSPTYTPADLLDAINNEKRKDRLVGQVIAYSNNKMDEHCNWTRVGTAEITVTLVSRDEVVSEAVKALQKQLEEERAESMQRQNAILDRISKLSALTFDAASVVDVTPAGD